jgi:biopolymer transport protein ExbB/TolQ
MLIEVQFWQLVLLLVTFFTFVAGVMKLLLSQYDQRMDERFEAAEAARKAAQTHWDSKFSALEASAKEENAQWQRIEREFLDFKAELPERYVRREDHVQGQSRIEAKLDGLAVKIQEVQLKGAQR